MSKVTAFLKEHPVPSAIAAALLLLAILLALVLGLGKKSGTQEETDSGAETAESPEALIFENGRERSALLTDLETQAVDPGVVYPEKITAVNNSDHPVFVRMTVRRFWKDETGKREGTDPEYIVLSFAEDAYNAEAWEENPAEATAEERVYYLTYALDEGSESAPLFDGISIDPAVLTGVSYKTEGGVTAAEYTYDGLTFVLEAEVSTLQTETAGEEAEIPW